jgi:hypothetical protein
MAKRHPHPGCIEWPHGIRPGDIIQAYTRRPGAASPAWVADGTISRLGEAHAAIVQVEAHGLDPSRPRFRVVRPACNRVVLS